MEEPAALTDPVAIDAALDGHTARLVADLAADRGGLIDQGTVERWFEERVAARRPA